MARICETMVCVVGTKDGRTFRFVGDLYESFSPKERAIEAAFYESGGFGQPEGTHHEIELTGMPWGHLGVSRSLVHVQQRQGTKRDFICYTAPLSTKKEAWELFTWWCLGTVYTAETGVSFEQVSEAHPDDMPKFIEQQLGIRIVGGTIGLFV